MLDKHKVDPHIDKNINILKDMLGVGETFDIIFREYLLGRKRAASFSINGMTNDILFTNVLEDILVMPTTDLFLHNVEKFYKMRATHTQVKLLDNLDDAVTSLLSGEIIFILDGESQLIVFDVRSYPARSPSESNIEKVTRGSRDSFVETIVFNTALIRRRVRDSNLRFEIVKVGTRSKCDVAVAYIKDITNSDLVDEIKEKLNKINIDGVPMAEKAIEEYLVGGGLLNPLPKVRYTERPDVASVHLLEGHVCVIVDTSPNVMILPTTLWHHVQHAEEYHQQVVIGSYLRLIRMFGILLSFLLPPLWLAIVQQRNILPATLAFLGPRDTGIIPLGFQFIAAEIGVELVRMATIHVPSAQSTALGFIGAFMLGDFATKVGLFGNEVIFYTAIAAVGAFATPSMEFAMAIRFFRVILLVLVIMFRLPGLLVGLIALFVVIVRSRSFGIPYLWPLLPFNFVAMKDVLFRLPIPSKVTRPAVLRAKDNDRLDTKDDGKDK